MASAVNPLTSISTLAGATAPAAAAPPAAADQTVNKETFLKLLVAQIKNQNPLEPTDSVQFLTQLAQFSELEQLIGMRQDLAAIRTAGEASSGAETPVDGTTGSPGK